MKLESSISVRAHRDSRLAALVGLLVAAAITLVVIFVVAKYGSLWLQARMSSTDVGLASLMGMSFRNVKADTIVRAQVMASQAGLIIAHGKGKDTAALEAHYLAGGDVNRVVQAIIAANRAGIDLDFDRAAAEVRRAEAIALLAQAFRNGQFHPNEDDSDSTEPDSILKFPGSQESA